MVTNRTGIALGGFLLAAPACGGGGGGGGDEADTGSDDGGDETGGSGDDGGETQVEYLSPTDHLIRASLALRGIRPSPAQLREVADDADALPAIVDGYLESAEFGATIRDLHNEAWLLRADPRPDLFGFKTMDPMGTQIVQNLPAGQGEAWLSRQVWEQPLRLVEHVVMNDLPYTEIVTADYTIANASAAEVWGLGYQGDGESWAVTAWDGSRPAAGLLAEAAVFVRHKSMLSNANRGRANAVAKALLCYDFLLTDIVFDGAVDLSDPDAVGDAVKNNAACAACHNDLDPLASFFYGHEPFVLTGNITSYPQQLYNPQLERAWEEQLGPLTPTESPPALFGKGGERIDDLGALVAEDWRFSRCAATRFFSYLTQTPLEEVPTEVAETLDTAFVDAGFDAKALAREIVLSDEFRVSHAATEVGADEVVGFQRMRPRQLARTIEDLTGFVWTTNAIGPTTGEIHLLEDSFYGYESLAGGIDSYYVTRPTYTINPTSSLVLRRLAAVAADHIVDEDFALAPADRRLLTVADLDAPDDANIRAQLSALHLVVLGEFVATDSPEVRESIALWVEAYQGTNDIRHAWKITLTAMFQDLRFAQY